ncbi:MAG: FtsX-like permease family protein [Desulfobacterales bacterium]
MTPADLRPFLAAAFRDLKRRPLESVLLIAALLLTIAAAAFPLLLAQATTTATDRMLKDAPALVVRQYDALGWTPLPGDRSVALAESVAGVVAARPRIWGRVAGPAGPLTVVGIDPRLPAMPPSSALPRRGEAVAGADVAWDRAQPFLTLTGRKAVTFKMIGRLDAQADIAEPKVVGLHIDDARELLEIPAGYASDLALEVFNPAEETAILPDLTAAFPWTVRITTRTQTAGIYAAALARMSAMAVALLVPALLALSLLVTVTVRDRFGRRFEIGLLKALGWTTGDIVRLQAVRALLVVIPAAAGGLLLAVALVFWPQANWFGRLGPEWQGLASRLFFTAGDAGLIFLEVTGLVVLPFLAAALGTVLRCAVADPQEMLERTSF